MVWTIEFIFCVVTNQYKTCALYQNDVSMVYGFAGMPQILGPKFYPKYKLCDNSTKGSPVDLILLQCTYFQDQKTQWKKPGDWPIRSNSPPPFLSDFRSRRTKKLDCAWNFQIFCKFYFSLTKEDIRCQKMLIWVKIEAF